MLVGPVGVVVGFVDGIRDMSVYNECTDDVDIDHLSSADATLADDSTHLSEVGNRLGSIIRPIPLQSYTSAVDTSLQVPKFVNDLLNGSFDSLVIGDVDSDV